MYNATSWLKFGLFSVGLGQSFAFVLVPPLARDFGLSVIETSTIFSISAVAWAITSASWGRASDNFGRRNIAVIGLIGYSISIIALITPLFLVERNILDVTFLFPLLIMGRLLNGLVGSATRPAAFAYIADNSTQDKRTVKFARLESSFLLGTVAGPLFGGFLILITKETPFYVFSFMSMIASAGIYLNLKNTTFDGFMSWILDLRKQLSIPHTLSELIDDDSKFNEMSKMAKNDPSTGGNPIAFEVSDFYNLYQDSFKGIL